jgi:peptidoglycan/LPS O-acetylase OafA/YrhL
MPDAIPMREIDSRDALRALGISAVVVNHAVAASLHGGLNLLLLISGISFARLCFGGRGDVRLISASLRFLRPLVTWSLVLCLLWFAVFGRVVWPEILLYSNWITIERVSKFPIWYTQVLVQMLVCLVVLLLLTGGVGRLRARPVPYTLVWLAVAAAIAALSQTMVDADRLADKLPHLHAWNFLLGWVFWAVLYARDPAPADRVALTALSVPLLLVMYIGLDAPGGQARAWLSTPAVLLLIWVPVLRLPRPLAHPVLLVGQAVLFVFFLHYPFILSVRNAFGGVLGPTALGALQALAGLIGPVILWAAWTAARRTWTHARRGVRKGTGSDLAAARRSLATG